MALPRPVLTKEEKVAGRLFKASCQDKLDCLNESSPPTYLVPNFLALFRHLCPGHAEVSTALELKEIYEYSPSFELLRFGEDLVESGHPIVTEAPPDEAVLIPAKRFGFIYKEGKCKSCGQTARSKEGTFVDAYERAPLRSRNLS